MTHDVRDPSHDAAVLQAPGAGSAASSDRFLAPDSASARLHERARRVMPGGNTRHTVHAAPWPPYAARAAGCWVEGVDGDRWLDFANNATTLIHGHAHPVVTRAAIDAVRRGPSVALPTPGEVELAELLCARVPSVERIRFANSGTEAVLNAIKAARAATGRPMVAKFEGSYHGAHDQVDPALAAPDEPWADGAPTAHAASRATPRFVTDHTLVLRYNDVAGMERAIARHAASLAAVIVDPMPSRCGFIQGAPAFLQRLRELATRHGIVLVFDEVISFRVAPGGMQSLVGVTPDLTTFGKIIGGGFPVGAFGGSEAIMAAFDPGGTGPAVTHAGTFNANPVTMAAGLAAMRLLTPDAYARLELLGGAARAGLAACFAEAGVPARVMGRGSLFSVTFHDRPLREWRDLAEREDETRRREWVQAWLRAHGVLLLPNLFGAIATPMTDAEVGRLLDAVRGALGALPA